MPSRFRSRQIALQTLFACDVRHIPVQQAFEEFYGSLAREEDGPEPEPDPFAERLALGAAAKTGEIDALIARHSEHWRMDRMPIVDRNILRLAAYEMKEMATPSAVVIDQALELARRFSTDDSIAFLNGVLDAVNRELHPV
ncbi:MAG: transcription antitermination factor NusB [Bryobacteraceae bacterium]